MAHYKATVENALEPQRAFELMADFRNAEDWDPATTRSVALDDGPPAEGSRFRLTMAIAGRENDIEYEIVEFDPPRRVVLRGENSGSVSIDEITVAPAGSGSAVTYEAEVTMKGAFKLIGPLFAPVFKRMGDKARDRMKEWLDGRAGSA